MPARSTIPPNSAEFQHILLNWHREHGRHTLPWQQKKSPYRVWISEIMLQQTQVTTVIDYFLKFMQRFPTLKALATAELDEVLHAWSGLGYYARARNLHKTAQLIYQDYHGRFPKDLQTLQTLPGIGRSTAGAILSLASDIPATILDGNVKRVLTRVFGIQTFPNETATLKILWLLAESLTPTQACADYNQGMMDLGATLCTRARPACLRCPLQKKCFAYINQLTQTIPAAKIKKINPTKKTYFLMLENKKSHFLLEKRPSSGIWGGLWCFPEFATLPALKKYCAQLNIPLEKMQVWKSFRHTFSHYHLEITPVHIKNVPLPTKAALQWYDHLNDSLGLAAPIKKLITTLIAGESSCHTP